MGPRSFMSDIVHLASCTPVTISLPIDAKFLEEITRRLQINPVDGHDYYLLHRNKCSPRQPRFMLQESAEPCARLHLCSSTSSKDFCCRYSHHSRASGLCTLVAS